MSNVAVPRWLHKRVDLWLKRTKLADQWQVAVEVKHKLKHGRQTLAAETIHAPGYKTGCITFSLEEYHRLSERDVDLLICHELYHLITSREHDRMIIEVGLGRVFDEYRKENEHCAEHFALVMVSAFRRKKDS